MLQILLAVIGMTMAGALGLAMVQQASLQSAMASTREDNRRLDMAVDVLSRNLVEVAGVDRLMAPGGTGSSYYQLPSQFNMITANSSGVPFQYCPLSQGDQTAETAATPVNDTVNIAGGTSYTVKLVHGAVAWDDAIYDPSVRAMAPVAIITSAQKGSTAPPPCSEVQVLNGNVTVPNGLARIVSVPTVAASNRGGKSAEVSYYITQNGTGNGSGSNDGNTAAADSVWKLLYKTKPSSASIYLIGPVTTGPNFDAYARSRMLSGTDLRIYGYGNTLTLPGVRNFPIFGRVMLQDINIVTQQLYVPEHGNLTLQGVLRLTQTANDPLLNIDYGGRMTLSSAAVLTNPQSFSNNGSVHNNGYFAMISSSLVGGNTTPPHYIVTYGGAYTYLIDSYVGKSGHFGSNRASAPLYVLSNGRFEAKNTQILRGTAGQCWGHINGDAFLWSYNQAGYYLGVRPETDYPPPAGNASFQTWQTYAAQRGQRDRAREQNVGTGASCMED